MSLYNWCVGKACGKRCSEGNLQPARWRERIGSATDQGMVCLKQMIVHIVPKSLLQGRTDLASLIIQSRYHEDQRFKEERLFSWLRFVQIYPMLSEGLRTSEGNFWVVYQ